ncbi:MAG: hypothetical protein OEL76_13760 [Siculibacillus sp.]|nr:hypothetical protein [Siculibacillus sp.]
MNDVPDPELARRRRIGRILAAVVLAALATLLTLQMIGEPLAALGAAAGAGVVGFALWGGLVVRPEGISYGRAAGLGFLATFAAFFGAAVLGAAASRVALDREAFGAAFFAFAVVLPVMVAAAIAVAAVGAVTARR